MRDTSTCLTFELDHFAGFQAQAFGDGAHGILRSGIDGHGRRDLNAGCGDCVDEVSETWFQLAVLWAANTFNC